MPGRIVLGRRTHRSTPIRSCTPWNSRRVRWAWIVESTGREVPATDTSRSYVSAGSRPPAFQSERALVLPAGRARKPVLPSRRLTQTWQAGLASLPEPPHPMAPGRHTGSPREGPLKHGSSCVPSNGSRAPHRLPSPSGRTSCCRGRFGSTQDPRPWGCPPPSSNTHPSCTNPPPTRQRSRQGPALSPPAQ